MRFISESTYQDRLPDHATHPNHSVVLISPHQYFETEGGSVFPLRKALRTVSLTCDPLLGEEGLQEALADFNRAYLDHAVVLAGITEPVAAELASLGFSVLKIGEEPWIDLQDFQPKGNRGKGVRAARNQALRAGCLAEEWSEAVFHARRREVEEVFREWRGLTFISMEGGILATAPFADIPGRRFFAITREGRLEAVLVATPIRQGESYYLEDLVYRKKIARGVQELAVLTALEALHASGASRASLGMVLLRRLDRAGASTFNPRSTLLRLLAKGIALFYNAEGQELFRKRFPIASWEANYLAFRGPALLVEKPLRLAPSLTLAWSLLAMFLDMDPTFMWPWA